MKYILSSLFFMLICSFTYSQKYSDDEICKSSKDKNFERKFEKAKKIYNSGEKEKALSVYQELLDKYPDNADLNYYYAISYYFPIQNNGFVISNKKQCQKAIDAFNIIYLNCPLYEKFQYLLYAARLCYFMEQFAEAVKFAKFFTENATLIKNSNDYDEAETIIEKSIFYNKILNTPIPFNPIPIANISTKYDEYLAAISPDGEQFYFTRKKPYKNPNDPFGDIENKEFFTMSNLLKTGEFEEGSPLPFPFNRSTNEGSPTISLNNDYLIFTKKLQNKEYPNYDLFYSELKDGEWTEPKTLGPNINHPDYWESQPSLSSDGQMLFFVSDRPNSFQNSNKKTNSDIWCSKREKDGSWGKAFNVGNVINTEGDERSPFLHTDNKTLYFSSSGHAGLGGQDIFFSRLNDKGQWSLPVNIGFPINSEKDEVNFFVSLNGKKGYFSSNNLGEGDWNIYEFELYEDARPANMVIIKGKVEVENNNFENTVVELRDSASNLLSKTEVNIDNGEYAIATKRDESKPIDIIVNVKKEGYVFDTKLVTIHSANLNIISNDANIQKIEKGKSYQFNDIYFGTNLYSLTEKSKKVIDLFVEFLNENATVKVEIQGHTDNIGDDNANQILSENRAKSVYDYVISKGILPSRIRYEGYGEKKPVATNDTPEGRAKNRRTIFLIYDK